MFSTMNSDNDGGALLNSMRVSQRTPNSIETRDGSISISWRDQPAENPYERAERAAATIVRACNAHHDLVAALAEAQAALNGAPNTVGLHERINAALELAGERGRRRGFGDPAPALKGD